jgi:hypothetical protein
MNMVTYADPPTPVEITRTKARRRWQVLLSTIAALFVVVRATHKGEVRRARRHQQDAVTTQL